MRLHYAVGGFYVTSIPVWIAWLKYLSFVYYGKQSITQLSAQCCMLAVMPHRSFYDLE